jgi:general secretion pathway protein G
MRYEKGFTLIELLIVVAIIGILAAIAIPNMLSAMERGKQKATMMELRNIAMAVEEFTVDSGVYPAVTTASGLRTILTTGGYIRGMKTTDAWENAYQVESTTTGYTIYSFGKDGAGTICIPAYTSTFVDQICIVNGEMVRLPKGAQN